MRLVNWRTFAIAAAGFGLAACGDDVTVTQPTPVVTVNPASVTCNAGQTVAIGASAQPSQTGTNFTFTSNGTTIATVAQSGTSGGATITCAAPGATTVTVQYGNQTIPVAVTVNAATNPVQGITINPQGGTIGVGGSIQLVATVLTSTTGANTAVRFSSATPAIATVDSLTGLVRGVSAGTATIIARSVAAPNVQAAVSIQVINASGFIQSLTATPATIRVATGATQQVTPNVVLSPNAPAGTSTAVTYTSSDTSIATVSSTGLITARRNGTAVITVASSAAPNVTTPVQVTVADPVPTRLSIQSVTTQGGIVIDPTTPVGTGPGSQNGSNVIVATLNLDPGDARVSRVEVTFGDSTNVVCRQTFSAQLAEAYRQALLTGSADVQQIVCPINVTAFDTLTGRPAVFNGTAPLQARVFGSFGGQTATVQLSQFQLNYTVSNANGYYVAISNKPDSIQALTNAAGIATDPNGRTFRAGSMTFSVLPVVFTSGQASGSVPGSTFTVTLTDANFSGGNRSLTATVGATGATTVTFPGKMADDQGTANGARSLTSTPGNLDGVTSQATGTVISIGGLIGGVSATNLLNRNGTVGAQTIFIDNQTPDAPELYRVPLANFTSTTIGGANAAVGFLNGAFALTGISARYATAGGTTFGSATNPDHGGVDRVTTTYFVGSQTTGATLVANGTKATTGADLAAANTNTSYNAAVSLVDALGNVRNSLVGGTIVSAQTATGATAATPAAAAFNITTASLSFGVDLTAPTLATGATNTVTSANNLRTSVGTGTISFAGTDDIGFGTNPYLVTGTRTVRSPDAANGTLITQCLTALTDVGVATFTTSSSACTAIATNGTLDVSTLPGNGEYKFSATVRDQAGNVSSAATNQIYIDNQAPTINGISLPATLIGNQPVIFTVNTSDNLEIGNVRGELDYGTALSLRYPATVLGSAFDNVFTNVYTNQPITIPSFIRSITTTAATTFDATTGAPTGGTPTAGAPGSIATVFAARVADVAGNAFTQTLSIPAGNIQGVPTAGVYNTTSNVANVTSFTLSESGNYVSGGSTTVAGATDTLSAGITTPVVNTASTALTFQVQTTGAGGALISPFVRIELWYRSGTARGLPQYRLLTTLPAGSVQDVGGTRTITSTLTNVTTTAFPVFAAPAAGDPATNVEVIAVGINANGDALVSNPIVVSIIR